jgi:archaeosine synthase beta-subunit
MYTKEGVLQVAERFWNPIMRRLRKERGRNLTGTSWGHFNLPNSSAPGRMFPLCFMRTAGCRHALAGGCTMCDYGGAPKRPSLESQMVAAKDMCDHIEAGNEGHSDYALFNVNGIGSFFDSREIPVEVRHYILGRIAANVGSFKKLEMATETRFEFMNEEILAELREYLGWEAVIEIGFGLESLNDLVREGAMNKKLDKKWEEKIALMRRYNIKICLHFQLKPPFLTERETVDEVTNTIKYLIEQKLADNIIVMSMNIRQATLVGKMYEAGEYELPGYWTVVEIMRRLTSEECRQVHFFGFITPRPEVVVGGGCDECTDQIKWKILRFSGQPAEREEILRIADGINCDCKREWQIRYERKATNSLEQRLVEALDSLGQEYLGKSFKDMLAEVL